MLPAPLLLPLFLAGGAAALIDEVTWFQLLALHAGGTSRAMAAVLATFMAGLGAGAILAPRLGRSRRPMVVCAVLEAAIGVCALAMPALLPAIGRLPPALQAPGFTLALLAPAVAMGATLPVAARALGSGRAAARAVGWLYAANTLGGVIGCLLAGFWLLRVHDTAVAARVAAGTSGGRILSSAGTRPACQSWQWTMSNGAPSRADNSAAARAKNIHRAASSA